MFLKLRRLCKDVIAALPPNEPKIIFKYTKLFFLFRALQRSTEIDMANDAPSRPVALDFLHKLLPNHEASSIHPLFDESGHGARPPAAFNDQELEQARQDNNNDARIDHWTPEAQMRWLMRQPLIERHYYLDPETRANYMGSHGRNSRLIHVLPGMHPIGGDAQTEPPYRASRKKPDEVYTPVELPESNEQTQRVQGQKDNEHGSKNICRTCFLNNIPAAQCSRSASLQPTPNDEACTRCSRLGIVCLDLEGKVLKPLYEMIATGNINNVRFDRCQRCHQFGKNCDREHPCKACRFAIPNGSTVTDCVHDRARAKTNKFIAGSAVGTDDPEYFMGLGYGPWGIGVRRPKGLPDLPGQTSGEPYSNSTSVPVKNPIREEALEHLENNNGEFNWVPLLAPDARRYAAAQSLYLHPENWAGARPLPAFLAKQGTPQFGGNRSTLKAQETSELGTARGAFTTEPYAVFQKLYKGSAGLTQAAKAQIYDNPHRPPTGDLNFLSVGDHPPDIFQFDDARGEGFDPTLLLQDADLMDEVASQTVPTGSIRMVDREAGSQRTKCCEELLDDNSKCPKVALAHCVARYHPELHAAVWLCPEHLTKDVKMVLDNWNEWKLMRAYPCSRCLKSMTQARMTPYMRTGMRIFGKAQGGGGADPVANTLDGRTIGGLQGKTIHRLTGCTCAKKLIQAYQCGDHRLAHFERLKRQTRRMHEWRISQSRDEYKTCYLCRDSPGVDHYEFISTKGGDDQDDLFFMCMICQGVITTPMDPKITQENRRAARDRLRGDIAEDFDMPDSVVPPAAAVTRPVIIER
ncbi:hypothetical protein N0V93_007153 [Gnomoniopsis smithogilvyi]|uniref:Uncharacterized protein n=1 Tax=Gnomoniopsis smithogilvyi TaxID=1191159 RepID=A0A9W8YS60_9PEZI|nr:hypothetical protein N0V93_007153 [Gnomoniopsis smithogilvyi]